MDEVDEVGEDGMVNHGDVARFDRRLRSTHLRLPTRVSKCGAIVVAS